jgi:hypothetical protein
MVELEKRGFDTATSLASSDRAEAWAQATKIREFISALEVVWTKEGHDLAPEAARGQRIAWPSESFDVRSTLPQLANPHHALRDVDGRI